ncbi:hypothetical protein Tco_0886382 [Tanacetum coccineum]
MEESEPGERTGKEKLAETLASWHIDTVFVRLHKKFYNSLGRVPNRCSVVRQDSGVVIVLYGNRLGRLERNLTKVSVGNSLVPFVNLTTPSDGSCVILDISTKGFSSTTCDSLRVKFSSHDLIVQNLSHDVQRGVKIYVGYFYMHMSNVAWYLKGTKPSDSKNELSLQTFSVTNELDGSGGKEWLVLMFSELSFSSCSSSSSLLFWNCGFGLSIEGLLLGVTKIVLLRLLEQDKLIKAFWHDYQASMAKNSRIYSGHLEAKRLP